MRVKFKTSHLKVEALPNGNWRLLEPLVAEIFEDGESGVVVVPGGYETDFESVPKALFFAYVLIKGRARMAATVHDFLLDLINGKQQGSYTPAMVLLGKLPDRKWIDRVFYAAMIEEGTPWYARELAYMGVSAYTAVMGK